MRIVLDTNILVSALLFKGRPGRIAEMWKRGKFTPVIAKETFSELGRVLLYPKFQLTADEIRSIIEEEILPWFDVVEIGERVSGACRDTDDDIFLSIAMSASALCIVTGDKDLLEIGEYSGVRILTVNQFLELVDG